MIKYLNKTDDFNKIIKNNVLIDFYAEWCGPCQMITPILEKLNIEVVKIDVDRFPDLALKYNILSVPTLIYFENSKIKKKNIGFLDFEQLKKFVEE